MSEDSQSLAARSLADGDPTGWFDRLYRASAAGSASVPWDRSGPNDLLVDRAGPAQAPGRRAIVVGCGLGDDAAFVAELGFETVAFDVAPTAIRLAQERHPAAPVRWVTADLLALPDSWSGGFDLVVESITVQALPVSLRPVAIAAVTGLVAADGRLLVIASRRDDDDPEPDGPPWPLSRADIDSFGSGGLVPGRIERLPTGSGSRFPRWFAEFHRSPAPGR